MANGSSYTLNIKALFDASNVKTGVSEIQNSLKSLKLPDKLTTDLNSSFANVNKALDDFTSRVEKGVKSKTDASGITKSFETVTKELNKLDNLIIKVQGELGKSTDLSQIIKIPDKAKQDIADLDKQIAQLQQRINATNTEKLEKVQKAFDLIKTKGAMEHGQKALELFKSGDIEGAIEILDKIINKLNYVKQTANVVASQEGLGGMKKAIEEARDANAKTYDEIGQKAAQQAQIVSNATAEVTGKINQEAAALHGVSEGAAQAGQGIADLTARQQQFVSEVDQVKSRIQYFFGLANSINLVKRAIRGAVDTIKELDKAMTETAVVTEYTVKDMWSQLPEYTKRANQLGVTTKEAYESATLYFQQGLNNEQAAALSTETLKMARIAGLDAAEATDRMTNALRGFNMALDEQSAQRVDDVYSQLAAHTASNVDEISTAMTKVASLAHNANMEFETTAAFLAQIIETTRESAETAGTALKTVVARFSEVKKLVDEGTLKGTDEEGQAIDVNKVGAALRTAGIDLNKYFLGEVGLDDIFIELASKWDNLTAVQQRYIATQAAGSRQQSRFIALMQDYARTQELVGMAYDAEGASEKQFEKTQDSLQSKLARLKNAWNEFLMGITNNGMVKGFVDILTTILNIVNKITSAFGDGLGGVLKFAAAFGTIMGARSLFSNGGLATQAIGSFLDKSPLANKFRVNAGLGVFETEENGGQRYRGYTREELRGRRTSFFGAGGLFSGWKEKAQKFKEANLGSTSAAYRQYEQMSRDYLEVNPGAENPFAEEMVLYGTPKTLFGALGNKFKGTKIGGALAAKLGGSAGAAGVSGAATLAAGLGIVTTAAIAAAAAIKTVYDFSPKGQLKNAQKLADSMSDVAAAAKQTASQLKKTKEENEEYTQAIADSTTASGRTEAIQNRNEYIQSLLEQDATYAKYLSSTFENGQLVLTLDEDALATAADKAAEAATQAAVGASFAQATVAGREAALYNSRIRNAGVDINARTIRDYDTEGNAFYRQMTDNEYAKYAKMASDAQAAQMQMQNYAKQAYSQLIDADALGDELAEELASAMSKTFDSRELDTANWSFLRSRGYWENEYLGVYGQEADKNLKTADIARAVKQGQQTQEKATAVDTLTELLTGPQADLYRSALDAFEGIGEAAEINFDKLGENFSAEDVLNQLGLQTNGELDTLNQLAPLATALGTDITTLRNTIVDQAKLNKEVQKQNKANIFESALTNGLKIDDTLYNQIKSLNPKLAGLVSNIASQAIDTLSQEGMQELLPELLEMNEDQLAQFTDFFTNFNLDDPISAFGQLKKAQEEALTLPDNDPYRQMLSNIEEANSAVFDTGNLVQNFITSASYEGLTSSIEDFIKANGKITANNIEELAENCSDLQTLLEQTTVTAQGLASAFTAFEGANLPIDALTSSLLAALSAGEDFDTLLDKVSQWIEDFNEGTDMKEGTEHISEVLEKATDYVYNWEFGNKPLENIYDHIFGEGKYAEYMDKYWENLGIDEIEAKIQGDIDRVKSLAEKEGRGALDALVASGTDKGKVFGKEGDKYTWDLSKYNSASEAIQDVANSLGIADDAARAFIEAWGSHMYDLRTDWDNLNFHDQMQAFSDDLGQNSVITQQELDALAAKTGKDATEIIAAINEIRAASGEPIVITVDWQDEDGKALSGKDLIDKFNETANIPTQTRYNGRDLETKVDYSNIINQFQHTFDNVVGPNGVLQDGINAIDFNELQNHLVEAFKLTPSQASEVADNIIKTTNGKFAQTIKVPIEAEDGSIEMIEKTVIADSAEGLAAAVKAELDAADLSILASKLADLDVSAVGTNLTAALVAAGENGASSVQSSLNGITVNTIKVPTDWYWVSGPPSGGEGTIGASGGIVSSYAKGSENIHIKSGTALTGEEGPEIVWNKNKGYAYVTGSDGPEFQDLKPGDRVFNASETKRIFKNSSAANGGKVKSFANDKSSGSWNDRLPRNEKGGAANDKKTSDEWKNELDWLYNLMEDIVELERDQKKFEEEFEDILTDDAKTSKDLYNLLIKRLGNLNVQLDRQTFALQKREQEMREFMDTTNDQDQYLWYNWSDRTLEIDWDAIDKIVDGDIYKHVKDLISEAEEIQGKMDDAEDAIQDIKNQIQELENIWRDTYVDFEKRVLDALVKSYQQVIDNYSTLNDTINNSNNEILEAIQNEINLQRQIRDNTETESDIADKEARLAYLQRDTTGANAQEILQLQKELDTNRQDYEDSLIDQAIQRLQDDNDEAAKQRDKQIEIMQAQLDYQKENGEFNDYISDLISSALSPDGTLLTTSELYELLNEQENWEAMSATNKQVWEEELRSTFKEVGAYLLKTYADWNGEFYRQVAESINAINEQYQINVGSYSQAQAGGSSGSGSGGGGGNSSGNGGNTNTGSGEAWVRTSTYTYDGDSTGHWKVFLEENTKTGAHRTTADMSTKSAHVWGSPTIESGYYYYTCTVCGYRKKGASIKPSQQEQSTTDVGAFGADIKKTSGKNKKYATGGLNTQTGLAWLDGTASEPEYVLNARQTQAFLKLADVLPAAMNGSAPISNSYGGDIYLNLDMHVDEIADDYDVDRIANRVKDILYDASSYRNVNTINFIR